jgi:phosphatidylinositol glycan class S
MFLLQVARSLSDISSAWQHTAAANYSAAAAAATAAHAAAEAAFSHPAVLAQLNFPESHKLGVYMPLFLPLFVPLIQGLMGQLVYYSKQRQRYQQLLQASRATS